VGTALISAAVGVLSALLGFVAKAVLPRSRSLDSQRADFEKVIESQRKDFEKVLDPVLSELKSLRDRVTKLESQHASDVAQHYKDQRRIDVLVDYVKDLLTFIREHVPSPPPPPIPEEISQHI
jgi:septal ring factor EnvC (AmiA/AmiB activator)